MRRIERPPVEASANAKTAIPAEPLGEGILNRKRPNGFFLNMKDAELLDYARRKMAERGIRILSDLEKAERGCIAILRKRGLLGEVGFLAVRRKWESDDEVLAKAERTIRDSRVKNPKELNDLDHNLYITILRRGLNGRLEYPQKSRRWGTDDEVLAEARNVVEKNRIRSPFALAKFDKGLYKVLCKRGLLEKVELSGRREIKPRGFFKKMADHELVEYAKRVITEKAARKLSELQKSHAGMCRELKSRGLLDKAGFAGRRRTRSWGTDGEVLAEAREFIRKNAISSSKELIRADQGLYAVLVRRKLTGQVFTNLEQESKANAFREIIRATGDFE